MLMPDRARQELHIEFNKMFGRTAGLSAPQYLSRVLDIEVEFTANKIRTVYPYLIHHTMSTSSGDKNLDQWARERKLFPWVAVAAPVKVSYNSTSLQLSSNRVLRLCITLIVYSTNC